MSDVKLYIFDGGTLKCKRHHVYLNEGLNEDWEIPVPFYVIAHPRGHVIVDGGIPAECVDEAGARAHWGGVYDVFTPVLRHEQTCLEQVRALGLDPDAFSHVVLSHLHLDHVGAIGRFPKATHIVQKVEMDYARHPDWFQVGAYVQADIQKPGVDWLVLDEGWGDFYDVHGDGSIVLIRSPGHTVGHQSILVRTGTGTYLLAVDAADTLDHWEERALPGALHSAVDAVRSVKKLRAVAAKTDATVIAGHDGRQFALLKKAPDFY